VLCVINYFAVNAEFTISGCVGSLAWFWLLKLTSGVVPSVVELLIGSCWWILLWLECSHIQIVVDGFQILGNNIDSVEGWLLLVCLDAVFSEEDLIHVIHRESGLVFVWEQLSIIFRCSCPENLSKNEFVLGVHCVINGIGKGIFRVPSSLLLRWPVWFDAIGSVIFVWGCWKAFLNKRKISWDSCLVCGPN